MAALFFCLFYSTMGEMELMEAVPNFSVGRDPQIVSHISQVLGDDPLVTLLHFDSGWDVNRSVFTLVGEPEAVLARLLAAAQVAFDQVDLKGHSGNHPFLGVLDVCPLVPLGGISMKQAIAWAVQLGEQLASVSQVPVFLYQNAAKNKANFELRDLRRGGLHRLAERIKEGQLQPDFGPDQVDFSKGVSVVGARPMMLAFNINIKPPDLTAVKALAAHLRGLRASTPKLAEVRFLGWMLDQVQVAQISTNLYNLDAVSLLELLDLVAVEAASFGLEVAGSQLVGMCPLKALIDRSSHAPRVEAQACVDQLGLSSLSTFCLDEQVIEFNLLKKGHHREVQSLGWNLSDQ